MTLTIPDTAEVVVRASHVPGPPQGQWTYADYCALPDLAGYRYEILAGVLYMAPAPIPEHENVAAIVAARLVTAVEDTGLGRVLTSPIAMPVAAWCGPTPSSCLPPTAVLLPSDG